MNAKARPVAPAETGSAAALEGLGFGRYTGDLWSLFFDPSPDDGDAWSAELWERGTTGIIEESGGWRAFFPDEVSFEGFRDLTRLQRCETRREELAADEFERHDWDAIEVGTRFYIAPPWIATSTPAGRLRLEIDSPGAFGTGRHESTQLCLRALERFLKPGDSLLDVGCGSGILSQAARLLGAGQVFSCDITRDALETTKAHGQQKLFQGSVDAVARSSVDLVIANIGAVVLDRLAADLRRATKPDGQLIVSGFLAEKKPAYFEPEEELREGDWLCWVCRPEQLWAELGANPESLVHAAEWWL